MAKNDNIISLLHERGPSLTSDLGAHLRSTGLSDTAARKRLSRRPEGVMALKGITFPKRARFLYLERQFGTSQYWTALINAVRTTSPAYAAALAGVSARGGILTRSEFDVASGAPLRQKKQISSETVLQRLCAIRLLEKIHVDGFGECVAFAQAFTDSPGTFTALRARLLTENVLLGAIKGWAGRMNLASPQATTIRGEAEPQFGTFRFDLCGPSYLRPLRTLKEGKADPGFLVADVILDRQIDENTAFPFIRKCELLSNLRGTRPYIPMLIADSFTPEALYLCRSHGVIATRPETLFGQDVAHALTDLLEVLNQAAIVAATNPDRLEQIFVKLGSLEGANLNLRGALFEAVAGHLVKKLEAGSIDIGAYIRDPETGKSKEIDIRLVNENKVGIYECKGHQPTSVTKKEEIEDWLNNNVAVIYRAHRAEPRFQNSEFHFHFWTCGVFDKAAVELLEQRAEKTKKYTISWKDGTGIKRLADEIQAPGIRKILHEHYFNSPLHEVNKNDFKAT